MIVAGLVAPCCVSTEDKRQKAKGTKGELVCAHSILPLTVRRQIAPPNFREHASIVGSEGGSSEEGSRPFCGLITPQLFPT